MRRSLFLLATILCLLCGLTLSVSAGRPYYAIYDSAGLLDYEEEQAIKEKSTAAMQEAEMGDVEINIIITPHSEYDYSDAIYSTRVLSESQDMILLVVYYSETRHYYEYEVVTFGEAQRAISMTRQNKISDAIYDDVKAGRLTEACEEFITLSAHAYRTEMEIRVPRAIAIGVIAGAVGALIAVLVVVLSYRKKKRSASYPLKEFTDMHLTVANDVCTGRTVTKVRLSSSSGGSGGGSRGGGGGRSSGRR